jgi:hypothetical protein
LLDLGATGATVIESTGLARLIDRKLPVLAGLQSLRDRARPHNATVFSVIEDRATLERAMQMVQDVCGDLESPGTGIVFTIPVSKAVGLARRSESRE